MPCLFFNALGSQKNLRENLEAIRWEISANFGRRVGFWPTMCEKNMGSVKKN